MDLELVADTVLTEEEHRHNSRQLTELQVKCVQVAVSLLSRPEALFLEQVSLLILCFRSTLYAITNYAHV